MAPSHLLSDPLQSRLNMDSQRYLKPIPIILTSTFSGLPHNYYPVNK